MLQPQPTISKYIQGVASQTRWKYFLIVAIQSGKLGILAFCYGLYLGTFMFLPLNIIQILSIPIWRSLKKVSFLLLLVQYHNFSQFLPYFLYRNTSTSMFLAQNIIASIEIENLSSQIAEIYKTTNLIFL